MKSTYPFLILLILLLMLEGTACLASRPATPTPTPPPGQDTVIPVQPTLTVAISTTNTPLPAGTSTPAHLTYQLDLRGAAPISGVYELDMAGDFSCLQGPYYEIFGAPLTDVGGNEVKLVLSPDATLGMKAGGTGPLKQGDLSVSVGDQSFVLVADSNASTTINKDGSGTLTFNGLQAPGDSSSRESGTVSWTCK